MRICERDTGYGTKVRMGQNDDHIGQEDEDPSRTLDAVKPLYEIGSRTGGSWLLSILGEASFVLHVFP